MDESGAEVEWVPEKRRVKLTGSADTIKRAMKLVARVEMHCNWGCNESKIKRLLRREQIESVLCRLSPMTVNSLVPAEKVLGGSETKMTIGKDRQNHVVVHDSSVSRFHCLLSFDVVKGGVFVTDLSTNGTFLNGVRLPAKKQGKVMLSHGDELLFKDPKGGLDTEFGYMCNLEEMRVKEAVKLQAPRRIVTMDDMNGNA